MGQSKVNVRLREVEQALQQLCQKLNSVQKSIDIVLDRNPSVVHGVPEQFMWERKQRQRAVNYRTANLLRTAEIPKHINIKIYFTWEDSRKLVTRVAGTHD